MDETRWTKTFKVEQRIEETETSKNPLGPKQPAIVYNTARTICGCFLNANHSPNYNRIATHMLTTRDLKKLHFFCFYRDTVYKDIGPGCF